MDELDQIKMRRLQQMQQEQNSAMHQEALLQQQLDQVEALIKQHMTKDAIQRYGNIKSAHPEKALQILAVLGKGIEAGQLKTVDDVMLKNLLSRLQEEKRDFNIRRI